MLESGRRTHNTRCTRPYFKSWILVRIINLKTTVLTQLSFCAALLYNSRLDVSKSCGVKIVVFVTLILTDDKNRFRYPRKWDLVRFPSDFRCCWYGCILAKPSTRLVFDNFPKSRPWEGESLTTACKRDCFTKFRI